MNSRFLSTILLSTALTVSALGQNTTLCEITDEIHFECDFNEMMEAIRLYEDTLSDLTEALVFEDYWTITCSEDGSVHMVYNCDTLYAETLELIALIEAARTPPVPAGFYDPCNNFMNVNYYEYGLSCSGSGTNGRDHTDNCWFRVNLQNVRYLNGDSISEVTDAGAWAAMDDVAARALYRDSAAVQDAFGLHYTPTAILDSRKLCPPGWIIPDSTAALNLVSYGATSIQFDNAQRRNTSGTWAPKESVHIGGGTFEDQFNTQFYALSFEGAAVVDSLAYYANNSNFNTSNPIDGNYVAANSPEGMSVKCRLMGDAEVALDPDFIAWSARPRAQAMANPESYYKQMPRTYAADTSNVSLEDFTGTLNGEVWYTGPGAVTAVGFKWGTSPTLAGADSVTAATHTIAVEWANSGDQAALAGPFSLDVSDLTPGQTYYYTPWAKNNFGYSYGDTMSFEMPSIPFYDITMANCGAMTLTYEGYEYDLIGIGTDCWFKENLQSKRYANGDLIPMVLSDSAWAADVSGAMTIYYDGVEAPDTAVTRSTHGRLYNWYAAHHASGICPTGWELPTSAQYNQLGIAAGAGASSSAAVMSETPAWTGTNSSGFSLLPSGIRNAYGTYTMLGVRWYGWNRDSSSGPTGDSAYARDGNWSADVPNTKEHGFSIRCVKLTE